MTLPLLQAAPGVPEHFVRRASTAPLPLVASRQRFSYLQPSTPHAFTLQCDDDITVAIGEGRFSVIELARGTSYRITSTAVMDPVAPEPAWTVATSLVASLEAIGFVADEAPPKALELDTFDEVRVGRHHAPFGSGAWVAEVWIRVVMRHTERRAQLIGQKHDACLVTFVAFDPTLGPGRTP